MLTGLPLLWIQLQISFNLTKLMDLTVDPCVDFYEYACGNYKNVVKIPDDKPSMQQFAETLDEIHRDLVGLLEEPIQPNDTAPTRLAKQYYKSCIDVEQLEKVGVEPLRTLFANYGGWPVVDGDSWKESEYDWIDMSARITNTLGMGKHIWDGDGDILTFYGSSDFKNSSKNTLYVDHASLGLGNREFYLDESNKKFLDAYFNYMVDTAVQLGAPKERALKELKEALQLETELANISVRDEDRRDNNALYRPMSIKDLKEKHPKIDFGTWFRRTDEAGLKLSDSDLINLSGQPYLVKLPEVLAKYSKRTIANFQLWKMALTYADALAPSLRENYRKYREALSGTPKFPARWEECVEDTSNELPKAVGAMYVRRFFSEQIKEELDTMVTNIRKTMAKTIDAIDWMDESTKQNAHKKLEAMIQNIAFPSPDIYNETWLMRDYQKANLSEDTYFANKIALAKSRVAKFLREFPEPVNRTEWRDHIAEVDARYSPESNKMTFLAGILRPPWYHQVGPDYYNYGRIGAGMGHELTHGFDDQGRQYDGNGNFDLWWTNETLKEFKNGAQCFVDQYGIITDDRVGLKLNGVNTQGENIADNGGVKLAFQAFKAARAEDPTTLLLERNRILPRLSKYTAEQLFFLSYGQSWCSLIRPEALQDFIVSNDHAPEKFRVNVPLQNNADFAQAFGCPLGSPMNPTKKCQIW